MSVLLLPFTPRYIVLTLSLALAAGAGAAIALLPETWLWTVPMAVIFGLLSVVGLSDLLQRKHAILRNYPISAHLRFL
ncbi:hypothetical protein ACKI1Q_45075, partial [Streptomyces galilaeus]